MYVGFNASCSDLAPAGATWDQFQISSVSDGTYSQGSLVVTLDVHAGTVTTIDWSSNLGVDGVFVKGGPGGYFYRYTSAATSDTGLTAPFNPAGQPFDPAHLLFCTEAPLETATPTMTPTFTPTVLPSSTWTPTSTATVLASATWTPTATHTSTPTHTPIVTPTGTVTPLPTPTAPTTATLTSTPTATVPAGTPTPVPSPSPTPRVEDQLFFPAICNICFDRAGEPNNSCAASYPVQPDTPQQFYAEDETDWYRFVLEEVADIDVHVTNFVPLAGQIAAYYGDTCGQARLLGNFGDPVPDKTLSLGPRPAGTYFIYISNDGEMNSVDRYELTIELR